VLLATGWTAEAVAEILLVDPNTVRAHFKRYGKRGLEGLRRVGDGVGGSVGLPKAKHLVELDAHLQANLYLSAKAVAYWVKEPFGVSYTQSGMTAVLRWVRSVAIFRATRNGVRPISGVNNWATAIAFGGPRSSCVHPGAHSARH